MNTDRVIDASVLVKCLLTEPDSAIARHEAATAARLVAPDLVILEIASIAAKKVRRGDIAHDLGARALAGARDMLDELVPSGPLAGEAFELSVAHGVSTYDGTYLALAMRLGQTVLTADLGLVRRATEAGLGRFIHALPKT